MTVAMLRNLYMLATQPIQFAITRVFVSQLCYATESHLLSTALLISHHCHCCHIVRHTRHQPGQVMSEAVRAAHMSDMCVHRMDDNITMLQDVLGACQRILQTPIPLSYTRHTRYRPLGRSCWGKKQLSTHNGRY